MRRDWRPSRFASALPTGTCAAYSAPSSASLPWNSRRRSACCSPSACSPIRRLPVTEIAFASGFGSLRRFNALFKQRYRLQPGQLRRRMHGEAVPVADALNFELSFRPPYDWSAISTFLGARAIAGVEML